MKEILFIAGYPDAKTKEGGMTQRFKHIDNFFDGFSRTYLNISFKDNFNKEDTDIKKNLKIIKLNFFWHFFTIVNYLRNSKNIYVHSIYNWSKIFIPLALMKIKDKNIILDIHGTAPEEYEYSGRKILSFIFNILEKSALKKAATIIYVTDSMKDYYLHKYPNLVNKKNLVKPAFSNDLFVEKESFSINKFLRQYSLKQDDVVFIYSGGTQKWQNLDLCFKKIKSIETNKKYKFIILSSEAEYMQEQIKKYKISEQSIVVKSVEPDQLYKYYRIAHYGFILRDRHILSKTACPTKLVEYLYYGITPVVKYDDIGDFKKMGYEYEKINDVNVNMEPKKSKKNVQIFRKFLAKINKVDLNQIIE